MSKIILMNDPGVTNIEVDVVAGQDPLVDARVVTLIATDRRKQDPDGAWLMLRQSVLDRLTLAAEGLPQGLTMLLIEGYRPVQLQRKYFLEYYNRLKTLHPDLPLDDLEALASRHVSPPRTAPHCAGAAVDVTLQDGYGAELDLGTPINATPESSSGRCYTDHPGLSGEQRELRKILALGLTSAGFVNYPTEWWHWSYGDRYWARATGARYALFGETSLDIS